MESKSFKQSVHTSISSYVIPNKTCGEGKQAEEKERYQVTFANRSLKSPTQWTVISGFPLTSSPHSIQDDIKWRQMNLTQTSNALDSMNRYWLMLVGTTDGYSMYFDFHISNLVEFD